MSTTNATGFRPDIQGMRAIAVAIVVLAHAGLNGFSGGFVGVDVFFVISGFLITGLLLDEYGKTGKIRYGHFLVRRLRRLLPALLLMLLVVQVASRLLLSRYEALIQTGSLVYAATWTSNLYFVQTDFNYFATLQAKDLYLHTWSLGVEEQFYLFWPWLVLLALSTVSKTPARWRSPTLLLLPFAIAFACSLPLSLYWSANNPQLAFYLMPGRVWQFSLGAIVCLVLRSAHLRRMLDSGTPLASFLNLCTGLLGLLLILGSTSILDAKINYPGYYALFPSVGAALLLFAGGSATPSALSRLLSAWPLQWLGNRSYSIYLWHWPVLTLGGAYGLTDTVLSVFALILLSLFLAEMCYRFVEEPFWKGRFSGGKPSTAALASMLSVVLLVAGAHRIVADVFTGIPNPLYDYGHQIHRTTHAAFHGGLQCDRWYLDAIVKPCSVGNPDAGHTAVLIGDSLGANWASSLPEIYRAPDWRVLLFTKSACAIVDVEYYYQPAGGIYKTCSQWRKNSIEEIRRLKPDIVFVSNSAYYEFSEAQWVAGTRTIVSNLESAAGAVVLIPGTPAISFDGPSCVREPYAYTFRLKDSEHLCEEKLTNKASLLVAGYMHEAISGIPNAHVLSLTDLVCPGQRCAARNREGELVFNDKMHLNGSFIISKVPEVLARLDAMMLGPSFLSGKPAGANQRTARAVDTTP